MWCCGRGKESWGQTPNWEIVSVLPCSHPFCNSFTIRTSPKSSGQPLSGVCLTHGFPIGILSWMNTSQKWSYDVSTIAKRAWEYRWVDRNLVSPSSTHFYRCINEDQRHKILAQDHTNGKGGIGINDSLFLIFINKIISPERCQRIPKLEED